MFIRGRRLRQNQNIRNLVEETSISVNDLIMPIFLAGDPVVKRLEGVDMDKEIEFIHKRYNIEKKDV